jgi:hypothetical protein
MHLLILSIITVCAAVFVLGGLVTDPRSGPRLKGVAAALSILVPLPTLFMVHHLMAV